MNEKEELKELYQQYLKNQCSAGELERFFELINKNTDDEEIVGLLSATWDHTELSPETGLIPTFLPREKVTLKPVRIFSRYFRQLAVAAILIIAAGTYLYRSELTQLVNPAHQLEMFSKNAERKQLKLEDGTKVWLSPNSILNYPDKFNGSQRIVSLEGEAFFEVAHDEHHPFIIKSGSVSTMVLGTSFNVSAYSNQPDINVTLVTGKVAVMLKKGETIEQEIITNNQRVTVNKAASKITKTNFSAAGDFLSRRLGVYNYGGSPFNEVVTDLESQYHLQISLDPQLNKNKFYGQLDMTSPIAECLNKLCMVMEVSWKKEGGQYVIVK